MSPGRFCHIAYTFGPSVKHILFFMQNFNSGYLPTADLLKNDPVVFYKHVYVL